MKKLLLASACLLVPTFAMATEYNCHSIANDVNTYLVFDDGPGGLDYARITAYGKDYLNVVFPGTANVTEVDDRATFKNTYDYAGDKLEVGFTGKDGLSLDLFVERQHGRVMDGTLYTKHANGRTQKSAFTCLED